MARPADAKRVDTATDASSDSASRVSRRGARLGKEQAKFARLKQRVLELDKRHPAQVRELYGTCQWARFDPDTIWLPCIVVPPSALIDSKEHLQLAKEALLAKRGAVVVLWCTYKTLSKQRTGHLIPFSPESDPNDHAQLSRANKVFLSLALSSAAQMMNLSPEELATQVSRGGDVAPDTVSSLPNNGENEIEMENLNEGAIELDQDFGRRNAKTQRPEALGWQTGSDGLEPLWYEANTSKIEGASPVQETGQGSQKIKCGRAKQAVPLREKTATAFKAKRRVKKENKEEEEYVPTTTSIRTSKATKIPRVAKKGAKRSAENGKKIVQEDLARSHKRTKVERIRTPTVMEQLTLWRSQLERWRKEENSEPKVGNNILDVLKKLAQVPVTTSLLEKTNIGSTISGLRKHKIDSVATTARAVRKIWIKQLASENSKHEETVPRAREKERYPHKSNAMGKPSEVVPSENNAPNPANQNNNETKVSSQVST
mmetsp:Transcript_22968/g.40675  ORF Transcript_22968/g.40675 Transcript_22968/m.40675 type:complete len:487 (+) Transcript_22968:325-1785(+)|eukprot:CAMPEP_0184524996 /NCGR_PEP_ID=MMETSP0198_2-20121128/9841_1 /TAXON_ID=1112570 /ORGANISM="Thraustochytrium sp., Strain LLF1b" /LENGTH=486 /DNA_ID=CAMNT_0026916383 /DNA_START=304 /DNA_END=1764 /DNA_ORIENTATION=+